MKWTVVVALLAACGSKAEDKPSPTPIPVDVTWAPRVTTPDVLAKWSEPPPPVIVLDAAGNGLLSSVSTWDALSTANPATGAEPLTGTAMALLSPRTAPKPSLDEDDGEEESGGTGGTVLLEEKPLEREPLPEAVIERGEFLAVAGGAPVDKRYDQPAAPMPVHAVVGEVMMDGSIKNPSAVIIAAPTAKASTLVDLVAKTNAALGVVHDGKVRPLRIDFAERTDRTRLGRPWLELRVGVTNLALELVPEAPRSAELATLVATLDALRKERRLDPRTRVDVLVDSNATVQRLVDVLVTLDQASVLMIGLGRAPSADSDQAKQRGAHRPTLWFGQPNAQGDLDKAIIREKVRGQHVALLDCYAKQLASKPTLSGTVSTPFFISPKGKVITAASSGLDPAVATCVQEIIKTIEFPQPKGGGGVQVYYPMRFEP